MVERINEPVSVIMVYRADKQIVQPVKILWRGREYKTTTLGYHHKEKEGNTLLHVFSVANESTAFKLQFNTETLHWILEEIYDTTAES